MNDMQKYECASDSPDVLSAYTSVQGAGKDDVFALVCESGTKKVSVLLELEDAQRLLDQLTDFITEAITG